MKLGELFFQLGFKADTMKLKDFGKAVADLNLTSVLTAGIWGGMVKGATELVKAADEMALGINKFGRETGQSTQDVQKWTRVAEKMGVGAETVVGGIKSLQDQIFRMRITGEGSNIWAMLGIDPTKDTDKFETLRNIGVALSKMDIEMQRFFLNQLGLGEEWLNIFPEIVRNYDSLLKEQTLSEEKLAEMNEYHKQMVTYGQNLKLIFADLGVALMPAIKGLMEIANSINDNILKSWAWKGILESIGQIATAIAHPIKTMKEGLGSFGSWINQYRGNMSDAALYGGTPEARTRMMLGPATLASMKSVQVQAPITINAADPHTTGRLVQQYIDKQHSDAELEQPSGSY